MGNRFTGRIKSGEIESIEALKSEFKVLAKLSHPDLVGPQAGGDEFARLRAEYESALRDFAKHRFGARKDDREGARSHDGTMSDEAWICLSLLLKRGFPKIPRHEKEALRYEYARWRFTSALGVESRGAFSACETELLDLKSAHSKALNPAIGLLRKLIDYREKGLSAMRTDIVLSLGRLRIDPRIGSGYRTFVLSLAGELGLGMELAGSFPGSTRSFS